MCVVRNYVLVIHSVQLMIQELLISFFFFLFSFFISGRIKSKIDLISQSVKLTSSSKFLKHLKGYFENEIIKQDICVLFLF